jgi:ferredoxin
VSTVSVTILPDRRTVAVEPGTVLLRAAHAQGIDITATCGGRGRCTSCRVKVVEGTAPPGTINDQLQLGDDLVREGYRLSCQLAPTEPLGVQIAPPLDERAFQILGVERDAVARARVSMDAGIRKTIVRVELPQEEHHQTSDVEQLALAAGLAAPSSSTSCARFLTLRGQGRGDRRHVSGQSLGVERGDTHGDGLRHRDRRRTTSVVTTCAEFASGELMASVSSLNPQATFGGSPVPTRSPSGTRPTYGSSRAASLGSSTSRSTSSWGARASFPSGSTR